jgi:hypothetical protein
LAQFVAYVYPERRGFRVVVEGLGDLSVDSLAEAERAAVGIVARSVFASYPDREFAERPGTADRIALELRIVLRPSGPAGRAPAAGLP